ncbi:MAG: hypothetical protein GF355_08195 [Candidatus Eisenbacteria bacterium]|nr:hypothetical protein [Candidatus Eisenbacteria bacterium]
MNRDSLISRLSAALFLAILIGAGGTQCPKAEWRGPGTDEFGGQGAPRLTGVWSVAMGQQPLDGSVDDLVTFKEKVLAAGSFQSSGDMWLGGVARWDDVEWGPLGAGTNGAVVDLTVYDGILVAAGSFTIAGGVPTGRIALWNGANWTSPAGGCNDFVTCLAVYKGRLIVGGGFTSVGGQAVNHIAAWDGASWHPLGTGTNHSVTALGVYGDDLYASGWFTQAGGVDADYIGRWDGSSWFPVAGGLDDPAFAFEVWDGRLVAGGQFTSAGGQSALRVAQWDGAAWSSLGGGLDGPWAFPKARALASFQGDLYAGGLFRHAGTEPCSYIARWDGESWSPLGSGLNDQSYAMLDLSDRLLVGGAFTTAGELETHYVASWLLASSGLDDPEAERFQVRCANPYQPGGPIRLENPPGGRLEVGVFDVAGRKIWQVLEVPNGAGDVEVFWDGRSCTGRRTAAGVYYLRAVTPRERLVRCLVLAE